MATWPLRTLWWTCRTERTEMTDPHVVDALMTRNVSHLRELQDMADDHGINTGQLEAKADALEAADAGDMTDAIGDAYQMVYGSGNSADPDHSRPQTTCPFEREGADMACHRCPVAGLAIKELIHRQEWSEIEP